MSEPRRQRGGGEGGAPDGPGPGSLLAPSQVSVKTVLTVCLTVTGFAVAVALLARARVVAGLVVVSALLAVTLQHAVRALTGRGWRRGWAIIAVVLGVLVLQAAAGALILQPAIQQTQRLTVEAPQLERAVAHSALVQRLEAVLHLSEHLDAFRQQVLALGARGLGRALQSLATAVVATVATTFVTLFMLIFGPALVRELLAEARPQNRPRYARIAGNLYQSLGGFIGGMLLIAALNATATTTFLAILRVPYFLPLGIAAGLGSLVPFAGTLVVGVLITLTALLSKGLGAGLATLCYYLVYHPFENHVLGPLVFRRTARLNPLLSLVAVLFGGEMAGVEGALLAVPTLAVAKVLVQEVLAFRRARLGLHPPRPEELALHPEPPPDAPEPPPPLH